MKGLPMLFFGGANSHYFYCIMILILPHIFHFSFAGKKRSFFSPSHKINTLYKIHILITHESIDFSDSDLREMAPALKNAFRISGPTWNMGKYWYMPEGYWHYLKYLSPVFR